MQKTIEVELRAVVSNHDSLTKSLTRAGATFRNTTHIKDIYFCRKDIYTVDEIEMNEVGSYSLRLRTTTENNETTTTLNTKTITSHGDHSAWEEHEVTVNDFKEAAHILLTTEFKPYLALEKHRHTYTLDDAEILLEDIVDFGTAVEIEIMCAPGEEDITKQKVHNIMTHTLGIAEADIAQKSVTNIILRQRVFQQVISL